MKKILISFLVIYFLLSLVLSFALKNYLEESSFYWEWTRSRNYQIKEYKIIILGDSQWISGLNLEEFSRSSRISEEEILVIAKPSEQPEGIELDLEEIWAMGIRAHSYIINLSPTNVTKSDVFQAHKPLQLNFGRSSYRIFWKPHLWKIYYPDASSFLFHMTSLVFPILSYNSQISPVFRILPLVDGIKTDSNQLSEILGPSPFEILRDRKNKNKFLTSILPKQGLWEWRNYSDRSSDCLLELQEPRKKLPIEASIAFSKLRNTAIDSLERILTSVITRNEKIYFVHIPFSPEMESLETIFPFVWNDLKNQTNPRSDLLRFIEAPNGLFASSDFIDYTHLNSCGSRKLSRWLGNFLQEKK